MILDTELDFQEHLKDKLSKISKTTGLLRITALKVSVLGVYSGPYSVRMRENTDQNNSEYGHFLRSENNKLSMGQFKKYVTCIKVLFIVLTYITLSPISLNITLFVCMAASGYHIISKEIEKRIMDTIVFVSNPY